MTKEFRDGNMIEFDANTTVQLYPIILFLGGGDTKWVSCVLGKEVYGWPALQPFPVITKGLHSGTGQAMDNL